MTKREKQVFNYIVGKKRADYYTEEAKLLSDAKVILGMLGAVVIRETTDIKGISDLIICYEGRFIACELKDNIGIPSIHQTMFLNEVRHAGGWGGVCASLRDVFMLVVCGVYNKQY